MEMLKLNVKIAEVEKHLKKKGNKYEAIREHFELSNGSGPRFAVLTSLGRLALLCQDNPLGYSSLDNIPVEVKIFDIQKLDDIEALTARALRITTEGKRYTLYFRSETDADRFHRHTWGGPIRSKPGNNLTYGEIREMSERELRVKGKGIKKPKTTILREPKPRQAELSGTLSRAEIRALNLRDISEGIETKQASSVKAESNLNPEAIRKLNEEDMQLSAA